MGYTGIDTAASSVFPAAATAAIGSSRRRRSFKTPTERKRKRGEGSNQFGDRQHKGNQNGIHNKFSKNSSAAAAAAAAAAVFEEYENIKKATPHLASST